MNRHQKKLEKLLEKKKINEIINLINHDQKGELSLKEQKHSLLLEEIENNFDVQELFVDLCTFVFKENHTDIYQKLINYREFYKSFSFESYCDFTTHLISIENGELEMFVSILDNFDYKENKDNKSLIEILSMQCKRAIIFSNEKNCHLHKGLVDSVIQFIKETKDVFFDISNEKTYSLIKTLTTLENEYLEQQKQPKSKILKQGKGYKKSVLKPLYENDPSFLLRNKVFTENFEIFSIIVKSMILNTSSDYVFNVYLSTMHTDGKTLLKKIKDEYSIEYVDFLEKALFQNSEKNQIEYSFSYNYNIFSLKIDTFKNKEQHRFNINNIGHIMLKENRNTLVLVVDNNTIEIYGDLFSTEKEYNQFKSEVQKFINSDPQDEEIISLKTNLT